MIGIERTELDNKNDTKTYRGPVVKVIGIGGAGNNAVNRMINDGVSNVEFIACNTDDNDLKNALAETKIQLGVRLTQGLGAGGNPEVGRESALESTKEVEDILEGTNMVFITAGMGGGTGTGAAPVIAKIAKDRGVLTVGIVTKPFSFEGPKRRKNAEKGIEELKKCVDTIVVIPNNKLLEVMEVGASMEDSFKKADEILRQGVQSTTDLLDANGLINLDFNDIKSVMKDKGPAYMGVGRSTGKNAVENALNIAISSPLVDTNIVGGTSVLVNFTGDSKLIGIHEVNNIMTELEESLGEDVDVFFGISIDERLTDEVLVTVITTGLDQELGMKSEEKHVAQTMTNVANVTNQGNQGNHMNPNNQMNQNVRPHVDEYDMPEIQEAIVVEPIQREVAQMGQRQPQKRPVFEIPDVFRKR